jgi:hypothetical protein
VLTSGSYARGFVRQADDYGDIELVGLRTPSGVFGGSSRSWNTREAFDEFVGAMIEDLRAAMPVDDVYLALHGARAVRDVPRPEAEIARRFWRVREDLAIGGYPVPEEAARQVAEAIRAGATPIAVGDHPRHSSEPPTWRRSRMKTRTSRTSTPTGLRRDAEERRTGYRAANASPRS